jgi:hypothetical protein
MFRKIKNAFKNICKECVCEVHPIPCNKKVYMAKFSILEEAKVNSQSIDEVIENLIVIKKKYPDSEITGVFVAHNLKLG